MIYYVRCQRKKKEIISMDVYLENVYGNLKWDFIVNIVSEFKIQDRWINFIHEYITLVIISAMLVIP